MEYAPYTPYSQLINNAFTLTEGFDSKQEAKRICEIIKIYSDFERGKQTALINQNDIQKVLSTNDELQKDKRYKKYIPFNGKNRQNAVDEMLRDKLLLSDTNQQTYILGTIAVASLVVLSFYI